MKRTAAIICISLCLCALISCGEKEYNIDKSALAAAIVEASCFSEELTEVPSEMLKFSYQIPDSVSAVLYRCGNATAEELTVLEATTEAEAKTVLDTVNGYLSTLAATYDKYNAKEAARIRNAIAVRRGKYVIVCICNDKPAAEKVIDEYFK